MPNFDKLAKAYELGAVKALQNFIRINSVYDETTSGEGAP